VYNFNIVIKQHVYIANLTRNSIINDEYWRTRNRSLSKNIEGWVSSIKNQLRAKCEAEQKIKRTPYRSDQLIIGKMQDI